MKFMLNGALTLGTIPAAAGAEHAGAGVASCLRGRPVWRAAGVRRHPAIAALA